jgi:hypothetical protein
MPTSRNGSTRSGRGPGKLRSRKQLFGALTVGVTPVEVKEIVYHAVPYLGMAKVFDFLPGRPSARAATRDGPRGSKPRAPPADRSLAEA